MPIVPLSLGTGSNRARFGHAGACRHINCYAEQQNEDAKAPLMLVAHDGLTDFATLASAGVRGMIEVGAYAWTISGRQAFRVDQGGGVTSIGGIPTDGPVYMVRNRRVVPQVAIQSSGLLYVIDTGTSTMTQVTDVDLPPGSSITVLDGYGIIPVSNGRWFISGLDDFTTWDALEFGTADSNPDEIVRAATREGELVLFGERSTEWWRDTGDVDFAFAGGRVAIAEIGCLAAGSVATLDRTLIWVAHDGTVRIMQGYDGQRISTHEVERAIAAVSPGELTSTSWASRGHQFYALSSNSWTYVWNKTTGTWSERKSYGSDRWRGSVVSKLGTQWIVGDATLGKLYRMSPDATAEGSDPLVMTVQTPPSHAFPYRASVGRLDIDVIPGVGLNTNSAAELDPEMMVKWSHNGGQTWAVERRVRLGRQGESTLRAVLWRLGIIPSTGRTYEFSISAAVAKGIVQAGHPDEFVEILRS